MENKFGFKQITKQTPTWAKWTFRVTMMLTTAAAVWVGATNLIQDSVKYEAILLLKVIDPLVFGLSKLFGVEVESDKAE